MNARASGTSPASGSPRVPGPYSDTSAPARASPHKLHALKSHPLPFQAVWERRKGHEVRRNDRGIHEGDEALLREWTSPLAAAESGATADISEYTGREVLVRVGHMTQAEHWPDLLARGAIAFDVREVARCEDASLSRSLAAPMDDAARRAYAKRILAIFASAVAALAVTAFVTVGIVNAEHTADHTLVAMTANMMGTSALALTVGGLRRGARSWWMMTGALGVVVTMLADASVLVYGIVLWWVFSLGLVLSGPYVIWPTMAPREEGGL